MRYIRIVILCVGALVAMSGSGAASPPSYGALVGWTAFAPVQVTVLTAGSEVKTIGIADTFLLDTTELALRRNGIPIHRPKKGDPPHTILEVTLFVIAGRERGGIYAWHISVDGLRHACDGPDHIYPRAWENAGMGYCVAGERDKCSSAFLEQSLGETLTSIIDEFSLDYLRSKDRTFDLSGLVPVCIETGSRN